MLICASEDKRIQSSIYHIKEILTKRKSVSGRMTYSYGMLS